MCVGLELPGSWASELVTQATPRLERVKKNFPALHKGLDGFDCIYFYPYYLLVVWSLI